MSSDPFDFPDVSWQPVSPALLRGRRIALVASSVPVVLGLLIAGLVTSHPLFAAGAGLELAATAGHFFVLGRQVRAIAFAERAEDLVIRHGVWRRHIVVMPYGRMQFVDLQAGPLARRLGYATIQCHSASPLTNAKIPGVPVAEATRLRDELTQRGRASLAGL
ncbi:MAG: PH domain-containing protein [Angustibacter sp.]